MNLSSKYKQNRIVKNIIEISFLLFIAMGIRIFIFGLYLVPSGSMETTLLVGERFLADKFTVWFKPIKRGEIIGFNDPTYSYSDNYIINLYQRYISLAVSNWTKRVIAVPGDYIKGRIENGKPVVYLNGEKLEEPYKNEYPLIVVHNAKGNPNDPNSDGLDLRSFDPSKPYDKQLFYKINPSNIWQFSLHGGPSFIYSNTPARDGIDIYDRKLGEDEYWVMGDNRLNSHDSRAWPFHVLNKKQIHSRIIYRLLSVDSEYSWLIVDILVNPISFWKKLRWSRCFNWVK